MQRAQILAITVSAALGFASSCTQLQERDENQTARLIERIDGSRSELPDGDFALQAAANPHSPGNELRTLIADLKDLHKEALDEEQTPALARPYVAEAIDQFKMALHHRSRASPNLDAMLEALQSGIELLASARQGADRPVQAKLSMSSDRAAAVARQIATAVVDLAARGDHHDVVERARADLAQGELALSQEDPVAAVSLFRGGLNLAADVITFHVDVFEDNIRDVLAAETIGYSYSIGLGGLSLIEFSDGEARTAADFSPNALPQSPTKEMFVASMSKTLSAVALLKALDEESISLEESISDYLPADWVQGPNLEDVTFRHLLTHRSGLDPAGDSKSSQAQELASLQGFVAVGSAGVISDTDPSVYTNVNFSLMRVLIPQIANGPDVIAQWNNIWPLDAVYAALYSIYVDGRVLTPAGIDKITCEPKEDAATRTLLYSTQTPNANGFNPGDWSLRCGAAGWYLSANELARFLANLRFTKNIIGPATREKMDELFLGWLDPASFGKLVEGVFATYRAHGGDFPDKSNPGMTGCMMNFQINVQASLLINSRGGDFGGKHACQVLMDAYDNAWF